MADPLTQSSLDRFVADARASVERALDEYLPRPPACPPLIGDAIRYAVFAGGKRLRPLFAIAAADAVTRHTATGSVMPIAREVLQVACAVEMIHTYSLIHDDLPAMDNDSLRRGRPTLHVVYGDAVAILAGDALQAEAFGLIARKKDAGPGNGSDARRLRVLGLIAEAAGAAGMVGGQTIDIQAAGLAPAHALRLDASGLQHMHERKTGALIRASAMAGAIIAGGGDEVVAAVGAWAAGVGLAFQIVDDILDVEGSTSDLGKTTGKDQAADKPSYPALFGLERSRALAAESTARAREALARARLDGSWLGSIADWTLKRSK